MREDAAESGRHPPGGLRTGHSAQLGGVPAVAARAGQIESRRCEARPGDSASALVAIAFGAACALLVSARARGAAGSSEAFASPSRGEILAPGSILEVRWTAACDGATEREDGRDRVEREREPMREVDEAELVLSLDGGLTFPIRVSTELSPCAEASTGGCRRSPPRTRVWPCGPARGRAGNPSASRS